MDAAPKAIVARQPRAPACRRESAPGTPGDIKTACRAAGGEIRAGRRMDVHPPADMVTAKGDHLELERRSAHRSPALCCAPKVQALIAPRPGCAPKLRPSQGGEGHYPAVAVVWGGRLARARRFTGGKAPTRPPAGPRLMSADYLRCRRAASLLHSGHAPRLPGIGESPCTPSGVSCVRTRHHPPAATPWRALHDAACMHGCATRASTCRWESADNTRINQKLLPRRGRNGQRSEVGRGLQAPYAPSISTACRAHISA